MNWRHAFFSFRGRLGRKAFWIGFAGLTSASMILSWLLDQSAPTIASHFPRLLGSLFHSELSTLGFQITTAQKYIFVFFIISVLLAVLAAPLYMSLAIEAKRLHDRGRSAWWVVPLNLIPTLVSGPSLGLPLPASIALAAAGAGLLAWAVVELGFLRGEAGTNRYGPDPLGPDRFESKHAR